MLGEEFCSHNIEIGVKRLKEYGLEPVFMPNVLKGIEYLQTHPQARANDLKYAFLDNSVTGIVAVNKSLIEYQKPAIGEEKSAIDDKKSAVYRIKSAIEQQKYNEPSKANILKVYDEIEKNQIFGTKEIKEILDCSPSTARAVMTKLRDMKVVKAVNGKGKGKYVFIE